jgi:hypothetical protein
VFGRRSNPHSHHIYQVASPGRHVSFALGGKPILELRASGHMTVFPDSVHECGETIEFETRLDGQPGSSDWATLEAATLKIATATVVSKHWQGRALSLRPPSRLP